MTRRLVVLAVLIIGLSLALAAGLPALGLWLVVADPLAPSDAIFVLDGQTPAREVEAAALYHRGLAPVVAVSRSRDAHELARRLAGLPTPQETARGILVHLRVPERAILRLEPVVQNTVEELAVISDVAHARGFQRVILLSSPSHTRRVRVIWNTRARGVTALVHPTSYETFDARRWWRSRRGVEAMLHEVGGIVNFKLGSLLPTFDEGEAKH
jgi:uncharacterized SAM-binding protein YcdF (DUF218 family)